MVTVGASFKVGERGNVKKVYPGEAAKELTSLKKHVAEQDKKLVSQDQRIGQLETCSKNRRKSTKNSSRSSQNLPRKSAYKIIKSLTLNKGKAEKPPKCVGGFFVWNFISEGSWKSKLSTSQ